MELNRSNVELVLLMADRIVKIGVSRAVRAQYILDECEDFLASKFNQPELPLEICLDNYFDYWNTVAEAGLKVLEDEVDYCCIEDASQF